MMTHLPDMKGEGHGEQGSEHHHRSERHNVQEVPYHQVLQLLAMGDFARVVFLKHCSKNHIIMSSCHHVMVHK